MNLLTQLWKDYNRKKRSWWQAASKITMRNSKRTIATSKLVIRRKERGSSSAISSIIDDGEEDNLQLPRATRILFKFPPNSTIIKAGEEDIFNTHITHPGKQGTWKYFRGIRDFLETLKIYLHLYSENS